MTFIRTKEDFVCEHCSAEVKGDGYTNHCPRCLWGKHVDVSPGDRAEECHGMMEPMNAEMNGGDFVLTHTCAKCGIVRRNKAAMADDKGAILEIVRRATL
ncbi:MAG: RNHCP domain-containing protein [Patescibacteria group bacterium]